MIDFDDQSPTWSVRRFDDALAIRKGNLDPASTPDEKFELFSIPAFDAAGQPEVKFGREIGSSKVVVRPGDCLFSKLNPRIPRTWVVPTANGLRQIASTEFWPLHSRFQSDEESYLAPEFLQWLFRYAGFLDEFRGEVAGGGQSRQRLQQDAIRDVEVPIPPLPEQRRLVARVEALTGRAGELLGLNASLVEDASRLLAAWYARITADSPTRRFGAVVKLTRRHVVTGPDEIYPELGIRSFGKGTFHKPALTDQQLGNKRVFRINPGDLVFMNVFAWEGAIAVAKPEDEGRVGSHRFMAHEVDAAQATAEFLCYHFLTDHGLEQIRAASPGSAGRNRTLGITKLHAIPVPVPPVEAQRRFSKLYALREKLRRLQIETEAELAAFTPALLAKAFRGEL